MIDFNSSINVTPADYDSRIYSNGGTASNGNGNLTIESSTTKIIGYSAVNMITPNFAINNNTFRYVPPTSYTPTLSTGFCAIKYGSYSVTGSMMTVHITYNTIGAAGFAGSGIYGFGIPSGYAINTVSHVSFPFNGAVQLYDPATGTTGYISGTSVGNGYLQVRGLSMATTCVVPFTNNLLCVYGSSQTQGLTNWHSSSYYQLSYANLVGSFSATFPIN